MTRRLAMGRRIRVSLVVRGAGRGRAPETLARFPMCFGGMRLSTLVNEQRRLCGLPRAAVGQHALAWLLSSTAERAVCEKGWLWRFAKRKPRVTEESPTCRAHMAVVFSPMRHHRHFRQNAKRRLPPKKYGHILV